MAVCLKFLRAFLECVFLLNKEREKERNVHNFHSMKYDRTSCQVTCNLYIIAAFQPGVHVGRG